MAIKSDTNYKLESLKNWKPFSQTLKGYVGVIVYFYSKKTVQIDIFQWGLQWWWWLYDDDSFKMLAHCVDDYYIALDVPNLQLEFCFEMNYIGAGIKIRIQSFVGYVDISHFMISQIYNNRNWNCKWNALLFKASIRIQTSKVGIPKELKTF